MGKTSEFIDGLRVTDAETRDFAVMVLAGHMNKKLVAALSTVGQPAIGMCGGDGMAFPRVRRPPMDTILVMWARFPLLILAGSKPSGRLDACQ